MRYAISGFIALATLPTASTAALPMQRVLPMEIALKLASTASARCREQGYRVTITVLDRSGQMLVFLRDTDAPPHTAETSRSKAFTALTFRRPSNEFAALVEKDRQAAPLLTVSGVVALGGGVPIRSGGELVGAIGVGGAPAGEKDVVCAQAGLGAIADDLKYWSRCAGFGAISR
jgi:uncharacterized protein GlcG (DUF336 family)